MQIFPKTERGYIRIFWNIKGKVSNVYKDIELPHPDAEVAEKIFLLGGKAIIYFWDILMKILFPIAFRLMLCLNFIPEWNSNGAE
jgi:hypothetical protein